ncbi:MAG: hypothetical protein RL732_824 [Bacteroidota bacterium]
MTAYPKEWLHRNWIIREAQHAQNTGVLPAKEVSQINAAYPALFYCPSIFTRIALFVLTNMASSAVMGFVILLSSSAGNNSIAGTLYLVLSALSILAAEFFIRQHRHYKSGVDTSLLWMAPAYLMIGLNMHFELTFTTNALIILLASTIITIRYVNHAMTIVVLLSFFALLYNNIAKSGEGLRASLPFLFMTASALIVLLAEKMKQRSNFRFHYTSLLIAQVTGMGILFMSCNYYVVNQAEQDLFPTGLPTLITSSGVLFWILTFLIPLVNIAYGLYKREIVYLRTGLVMLPFLFMTYWHYYQPMALEWVITLKGAGLILIVYLLTRYLHITRNGLTSRKITDKKIFGLEEVEGLIASGAVAKGPNSPMGGGSTGGAGSSGDY